MKLFKQTLATLSLLGLFAFVGSIQTAYADGTHNYSNEDEIVIIVPETTEEVDAQPETTTTTIEETTTTQEEITTTTQEETTTVEETTTTQEETTVVPEQQETTVVNEIPTNKYYEYYNACADFVFTHYTEDSYNGKVLYNYNTGVMAYLTQQYAGYYEYDCYYGVWQPVYEWVWTYSYI